MSEFSSLLNLVAMTVSSTHIALLDGGLLFLNSLLWTMIGLATIRTFIAVYNREF